MRTCTFFQVYGEDERYRNAVSGFILMYCRGERQDRCVRKDVGRALGDTRKVPPNMLPNGLPMTGSDDSGWSSEVKEVMRARKREVH